MEEWGVLFEAEVLPRMNPTSRAVLAQVNRAGRDAVRLPAHLACAGRTVGVPLKVVDFAGSVGRLAWAQANGCPASEILTSALVELVAGGGHLEALQSAQEHGCPWGGETCCSTSRGHILLRNADQNTTTSSWRNIPPLHSRYLAPTWRLGHCSKLSMRVVLFMDLPKTTVYVKASPATCLERIIKRDREAERSFDWVFIKGLSDKYGTMMLDRREAGHVVIAVDSNRMAAAEVADEACKQLLAL